MSRETAITGINGPEGLEFTGSPTKLTWKQVILFTYEHMRLNISAFTVLASGRVVDEGMQGYFEWGTHGVPRERAMFIQPDIFEKKHTCVKINQEMIVYSVSCLFNVSIVCMLSVACDRHRSKQRQRNLFSSQELQCTTPVHVAH